MYKIIAGDIERTLSYEVCCTTIKFRNGYRQYDMIKIGDLVSSACEKCKPRTHGGFRTCSGGIHELIPVQSVEEI